MKNLFLKNNFLLLCLLSSTLHALATSQLEQVLASIEKNDAQLQILRLEHEATLLEMKAENAPGGPSVEFIPMFMPGATGVAEGELVIAEEFEFPTKYAARHKQQQLQAQVQENRYQEARRQLLLGARLLCIDIIRCNQLLEMEQMRLNDSESILALFEKRISNNDATLLELNKVKLDYLHAQSELTRIRNERMMLIRQLEDMNGGQPIDLTDNRFPEQKLTLDIESFIQEAMQHNVALQAAESEIKASNHLSTQRKYEWLPNINVGYKMTFDPASSLHGVVVGLSFPMLTSHTTQAAHKRHQIAHLQLEDTRSTAESELRSRYLDLQNVLAQMDHSDIHLMMETLTLLRKALEHGQLTALEYYTEVNSIYEKMQAHIELHSQSARLTTELYQYQL